jgi:hypothetical protein
MNLKLIVVDEEFIYVNAKGEKMVSKIIEDYRGIPCVWYTKRI